MTLDIISHPHAGELLSLSGAYLEQHESENNLPIGLAYRLAEDPSYYTAALPLLLSIVEHGRTVGVAVMTPPKRIILSRIDTQIQTASACLVRYLRSRDIQVPGVVGPAVEAHAFSECWVEGKLGVVVKVSKRLRVFEARRVTNLPLSPGKLRLAGRDDHALMARWTADLSEALGEPGDFADASSRAEKFINTQHLYIWDHEGPVSIAGVTRPMRNGVTIGAVYTPPEYRNKGYATSAVLSLTQKLLSDGYSFCSLYTDVSNPTSNSIYTKIGYVPIGDALELDF